MRVSFYCQQFKGWVELNDSPESRGRGQHFKCTTSHLFKKKKRNLGNAVNLEGLGREAGLNNRGISSTTTTTGVVSETLKANWKVLQFQVWLVSELFKKETRVQHYVRTMLNWTFFSPCNHKSWLSWVANKLITNKLPWSVGHITFQGDTLAKSS